MTEHPRKVIRDAVVALLSTPSQDDPPAFPTDAKARVYNSRDFSLDTRTLPAVVVYTLGERMDADYQHDGGVRRRIMVLRIEFYQSGDAAAADVDEGAWQVENAIHANPTLGNLVEWCVLRESAMAFAEQGERSLFAAVMEFEVIYYTHAEEDEHGRPTVVLMGFSPDIGPGNEEAYTAIIGGDDD